MSESVKKQFSLSRNLFLKEVAGLDRGIVEVQPEGFNNTIHWMVGHVLTVAEQFLFNYPKKSAHLPESYIHLFGNGTKPGDWSGDVPSFDELIEQLKEQHLRMQEIPDDAFAVVLKKPILGFETFGELVNMAAFHEANHLGQIHILAKLAGNS